MKRYCAGLLTALFLVNVCGKVSFIVAGESVAIETSTVDSKSKMFADIIETNAQKVSDAKANGVITEAPLAEDITITEEIAEEEMPIEVSTEADTEYEISTEQTLTKASAKTIKQDITKKAPTSTEKTTESTESNTSGSGVEQVVEDVVRTASTTDLFYENGTAIYNYCPSVLSEGGALNVFYCSNVTDGIVSDHICYRRCTASDGGYEYGDKVDVLQPTAGAWDSVHVCDPSVVSGSFSYNGASYKYLMAYLGCNTTNNQNNKIGLAVSNSLSGGWVKCDAINPLIDFVYDAEHADSFQWGVGQPSLINLGSSVLVCYTKGTYNLTSEVAEVWDLSDLNNPVKQGEVTVASPSGDFISNADFALSGSTLYMVCDNHPFNGGTLSNVAHQSKVYQTTVNTADILNSLAGCSWSEVYTINQGVSGYSRNHNVGLFRDASGGLSSRSILYTSANDLGDFSSSLFTYRLKRADF